MTSPAAAPTMTPGGRLAIRILFVAAAALLLLGTVGALTATAWGLGTTRVLTDSRPLPADMRSLVVNTADLPVAIRITSDASTTEPRVDLRLVTSNRAGSHRLDINTDATSTQVSVGGESPGWLSGARIGEITLVLPPGQARRMTVTTNQQRGVLMARADLDQLIARTARGAVILDGSARRIEVQTRHGSISTDDPISVSESFSATTVEGDISAEFKGSAPRTVDAVSRAGDIVVELPGTGPYWVRTQSGERATVSVPETDDPASAAARVTARSEWGTVVVDSDI